MNFLGKVQRRLDGQARERAVDLVKNLERSQCFVSPRLASESAQTQDANKRNTAVPVDLNAVDLAARSRILTNPTKCIKLQYIS